MLLNATADSSTDANTGSRTASRKDEHLRINIDEGVAAKGIETVTVILEELRLAMFCVGTTRVSDLRSDARLIRRDGRAL
jgi:isopentenyl diphosphate isomerase/L-lactate dehydrogenase-like FMN-dependent dehydrogenase